jgi:hypothetical protein
MKRPNFIDGVIFAAVASVSGMALFMLLISFFNALFTAHLILTFLTISYIAYLLWRSPRESGAVSALLFSIISLVIIWLLEPSFSTLLAAHALLITLVRSFAYHQTVIAVVADGLLNGLGVGAAIWAFSATDSLPITFWSYFLLQALFCLITPCSAHSGKVVDEPVNDRFTEAYRSAQVALRQLSN